MKLIFLFTGKTEDRWVSEGMRIYHDRLGHYCQNEIIELPSSKNKGKMDKEQMLQAEAEQVLSKIGSGDKLILLDEGGKEMSSTGLSQWMNKQQLAGNKRMVLLVGGAFGFHKKIVERADQKISLSKMTFTHQMVRVILLEQVYRAFTILKGEKYHHD
ncbi:MAG TPA: 23S rRNA (pseudouridine(1915)-N(3))-methyltransferase RlmH [Bacteroidia bacterium]|jgi:23S rRNA (pseudouridine1915-N3)-methyltransferase|nr:23S rRNA (pseudouridine(1915)-N(3))-methyltransferase RlmH [Bacteroidia bacterium]